jgi:hypothetical protein
VDRVVDSYGTFLPLLVLSSVKSNCPSTLVNETKDSHDEINDESDEIFDLDAPDQPKTGSDRHPGWLYTSTRKVSALEAHPHIITQYVSTLKFLRVLTFNPPFARSHLRVADMTRIFNRMEYEKQHRELRDLSVSSLLR